MARIRRLSLLRVSKMHGFVLLIMLVYLQILSLLAVRGMTAVIYHKKLLRHESESFLQRHEMMSILAKIDIVKAPVCMIRKAVPLDQLRHDINWWKRHGCQIINGKNQYYFVREKLSVDRCAQVTNVYNQQVIPVYYRNTLLYDSGVNVINTLLFQDTIVFPGDSAPSCTGILKTINRGRQMLRFY